MSTASTIRLARVPRDPEARRVLAFISPDIAATIVDGRQPVELTANRLKQSLPLPMSWIDQRRVLGFPADPG